MTRLEAIQAACQITDTAFTYATSLLHQKNLTEKQLARNIVQFYRRHGAKPAFPSIVAVNSHAATPHHKPGNRQISSGNLLLIDIGCRYRGFCSDLTRTIFTAPPTALQLKVYRIVSRAYSVALSILKPGILAKEVDTTARNVIDNAGYGKYFIHSTGHGVGRKIHQRPKLGPKTKDKRLTTGTVITIEPGIYLPHRFGIRLEDTVLITNSSYQLLTHSPHTNVIT